MQIFNIKSGMVSLASAFVASLCCVLPLAVVLLGVGSGAFMMTTMKYSNIFLPHARREVESNNSDIRNNFSCPIICFQCVPWTHRSAYLYHSDADFHTADGFCTWLCRRHG